MVSGRAGAVEPMHGLPLQPGVACAVVLARLACAPRQRHAAVGAAPPRRAHAPVRGAGVDARAVDARRISAFVTYNIILDTKYYFVINIYKVW